MSGETKTDPKTVDWKNLEVSNTGKTWQDLHDFVGKTLHQKFRYRMRHGERSGVILVPRNITKKWKKLDKYTTSLRAWENKMETEGIHNVSDDERIHRHCN